MPKTYINEIIGESEISQWQPNNRILISSPTGTGKTEFIFSTLYTYCRKLEKKILLLSNRKALRDQNEREIEAHGCDPGFLSLKNYQSLENEVLEFNNLSSIFNQYDYIVFDECHYFFIDSFTNKTDILMHYLAPQSVCKVFLFITATPEPILDIPIRFDQNYTLEDDFSFIKNIQFYSSNLGLEAIINNIPENEKSIFLGNIRTAYDLSLKFDDSSFICSTYRSEYSRRNNIETLNQIRNTNQFSCRHLFCTQVLDNGISIIDSKLKHIIIEQFDITVFVQFMGRKRISRDELINLYVYDFNKWRLNGYFKQIEDNLNEIEELRKIGKEEYLRRNKRFPVNGILFSDGSINQAKLVKANYDRIITLEMLENGYSNFICKRLGIDPTIASFIEKEIKKEKFNELMELYENKELDYQEQKTFAEGFFKYHYFENTHDNRSKGFHVINQIFSENNLGYELQTKRITREGKKNSYWVLKRHNN